MVSWDTVEKLCEEYNKAWLEELKRQNFHGAICIEYEYHDKNPDPDMAGCVKFFNKACDEIAAENTK